MKLGKSFQEVVEHVDREAKSRRDYYVPTNEMQLTTDAATSRLSTPCGQFALKETAHLHLAELCGIDRRYYQRMRKEAPFLLDRNVNHWLTTSDPKQRIVRTLKGNAQPNGDASTGVTSGGHARAVVSSRYAILDNDALLRTVEPVIDRQGLTIESCDVSEEKLTIKMTSPRLTGNVKVGDPVQVGIIINNSEVRCSAVEVAWFVKRLVCLNGMVVMGPHGRGAFRRHVGRDWNAESRKAINAARHAANPLSDSSLSFGTIPENTSRREWERAIWEQFQSSLRERLHADALDSLLEQLTMTTTLQSRLEPDELVERVANRFNLRPDEQSAVLFHLTQDGDMSLWGVLNAVTRTAQDVREYARATDLEELGGHLAHLTPREWDRLVHPN